MIMRYVSILIFLLLHQLSFSQTDTTSQKYYYPNGKISSEGLMLNGKPVGYWKAYYENGLLKSEGNRVNLELDGSWKFYNENGNISKDIHYSLGKKEGPTLIYDDSARLVKIEEYKNDALNGITTELYPDDSLVRWEIPFVNGIRDGIAIEYAKDGRIITMVDYNFGFIKKKEEINRRNSLGKQGTWREFWADGSLHIESRFKNNVLHGYYKEYDIANLINELEYLV